MTALHDPRAGLTATQIAGMRDVNAARARIAAAATAKDMKALPAPAPVQPEPVRPTTVAMSRHADLNGSPLDPRLTFSTFVQGRANAMAFAAARQVAEGRRGDPVMFNPLYIHAGVGLGKTHLLQAVTWAGSSSPDRKVLYLTAEKFLFGFVEAIKTRSASAFREALRGIDVLVIDDLQFLVGKTNRDVCTAIDAVIDAGRQVVVAADRCPADLESVDDRTVSRLAGGLVVEIAAPNVEMRRLILLERIDAACVHHSAFDIPDTVIDFLASSDLQTGRDLEAAVNRLLAQNKLNGIAITMEVAEAAIRDLLRPREPKRIKLEDIQRVVARQYNVSRADLLSARRTANVVRPRQVAMFLAKTLTLRSLPEIGRRFGGRDHTTVLHAVRKIEALVSKESVLRAEVDRFTTLLKEGM